MGREKTKLVVWYFLSDPHIHHSFILLFSLHSACPLQLPSRCRLVRVNVTDLFIDGNRCRCFCLFQPTRNQLAPLSDTVLYKVDTSPTPAQSNTSLYRLEKQKRIRRRGSRGARRRVVEEAEELVLAPPPAWAGTRTPRSGLLLVNASRRASSWFSNTFSQAPLQICPRRGSRTRPGRPPLP